MFRPKTTQSYGFYLHSYICFYVAVRSYYLNMMKRNLLLLNPQILEIIFYKFHAMINPSPKGKIVVIQWVLQKRDFRFQFVPCIHNKIAVK